MKHYLYVLLVLCSIGVSVQSEEMKTIKYAEVNGRDLFLDLYIPDESRRDELIVYVHGGAWRRGNRKNLPIQNLVNYGYAIASVDYRLTPEGPFPNNIHDIKAAIRFLRSEASQLNISTDKVIIAGSSAGGHLAALVGVTNNQKELEGSVGGHSGHSSAVQGIVSFYGASNLKTILSQSTPHGLSVRVPALELLLGGQPDDKNRLAELASPVFHTDKSDPPLLLIHGDQDHQMPVNQSLELFGKYKENHLSVDLEIVHGGKHGGANFYSEQMLEKISQFIKDIE